MTPRTFITVCETDHKENESFFFYCQLDGNEEAFACLKEACAKAMYDDMYGDYSSFQIDMTPLPESVVDIHSKLFPNMNGYYSLFSKHTGTFHCPLSKEEVSELDEFVLAKRLDELFYGARLRTMFA